MAKTKSYTGKDVVVLTDREHVRLRTQVYLGNTHPAAYDVPILSETGLVMVNMEFIPAVLKAVGEIIDNTLDEFAHISTKNKTLKISAVPETGLYTVSDNGRGIPIDKHVTGKYTPEVALGSLKAGRNFTDDKEVGVIGQNGVGAACTNYCSSEFDVKIARDGKRYHQRFTDGADKVSRPSITSGSAAKTGTEISFQLDPAVFSNVALPGMLMRNRAMEIAMTNPDITVEYNGEKIKYKRGVIEYVTQAANGKDFWVFTINEPTVQGEFYIIPEATEERDERMFTWVNSSLLYDGGKCNTQFFNAFFDKMVEHLAPIAKKNKCEIGRNDVRRGIAVIANIKIKNPEYDSQAKTRLTGPDLRKEIVSAIEADWKGFTKRCDAWISHIVERATLRYHTDENRKAIDQHQKKKQISGLLDATGKVRSECKLLITEGESAKSQISEARDPKTTAAFALTGKINNVYGCTPAQVLKMGKLGDLLSAIGLTPGKRALRSELNYGKIIISTDADYDGDDIFTLLVNLFFQFWPELFDSNYPPIVHRLVAPNVCVIKGKTRTHFTRRADYEKVKDKYKGCEVRYYKGLGSMDKLDWDMILSGKTDTLIPVVNDSNIGDILTLLFSNDADARKEWLTL
jgi:DNA gyrase/topoisomerase IV subunit B